MTAIPDINVDLNNITEIPLTASTTLTQNIVTVTPTTNQPMVFCIINITLKENTQSIGLLIDENFFKEFLLGLSNNNFNIQLIDRQHIHPNKYYLHYIDYPLLQLHANLKNQYPKYKSIPLQIDIGSKRQKTGENDQQIASTITWLQEQISKLKDLYDSKEQEL
ncbi:unnamed protein product [Penicillium salamii]|nr:unnamed protein product [Penicillium salamii]